MANNFTKRKVLDQFCHTKENKTRLKDYILVLSRKIGEVITIGSSVKITVLGYSRGVVRLGIEAPKSIPVHRKEVYDKIIELNRQAAKIEIQKLKSAMKNVSVKINKNIKNTLDDQTVVFNKDNTENRDIKINKEVENG
ncbi:MAG: carbon storage regulator CsrA [Candidatus Kapaibacteriota bacterium]